MEKEKSITINRKAWHDYDIEDRFEAGIVLVGTEVKSLRAGRVNIRDSYAKVKDGELYLMECHITPYEHSSFFNHDPDRPRKLLMHKGEIRKLIGKVQEKGLTIVPLRMYFNKKNKVKVEIAVAKGKKTYDKREDLTKKDHQREIERALRNHNKYK